MAQPDTARRGKVGPSSNGLITHSRGHRGRVQCELGSSRKQGTWRSDLRLQKLALGTWNVTSLGGKEPELVREVEKFRLDIVGFTSTHSKGSGTSSLERGWTLFHSGVAGSERRRAGVSILVAPQLKACTLEFNPVAAMWLVPVMAVILEPAGGHLAVRDAVKLLKEALTVVCAYAPNGSSEYPPFLDSLEGVLKSAPSGDWEEWPPGSEPEWCFVIGLLCSSQIVNNNHHVQT
ncbi:uncharacterized protein LOC133559349 [Nerophis ophidion]|uniref:uncharacterized protein LOC133559349 n=1 Tax=Nerophis ophidion TaxID=159077 RepID=UPI002ADF9DBF|nr:uncharacterized protein LOC133559349 [Nerophis ophidion]